MRKLLFFAAVALVASAAGTEGPLPGMPPVLDPNDIYAADHVGKLADAVKNFPALVYVPNSGSDTVDVIDAKTFKIVNHFAVGHEPQHVVPSFDMKKLWVISDLGDSAVPIDPATGKQGARIAVEDPYNMYNTPDGKYHIVVAERKQKLNFLDPQTMKLVESLPVNCPGVDHMDFTTNGRYLIASCEFSSQLLKVDVEKRKVVGTLAVNKGGMPQDVKTSPDGKVFYVADMMANGIYLIEPDSFRRIGFIETGKGAHGLYVSRDSKVLYISNRGEGSVSILDLATRKLINKWKIPGGGSPDMGGVSADGKQLWLSGRYNKEIYVLDTGDGHLLAKIPVGKGPHGLCVYPQPGRYSLPACSGRLRAPSGILISAGEASGDYYAAQLVKELKLKWPACEFFGCAGTNLREQGVEAVIRTEDLAVVGITEVIAHLPRIYRRFRKLAGEGIARKPDLAILTDSPDFHFRVARKLRQAGIPVVYLVAPQVWAWRKGRVKTMRRIIDRLLCIFPFEEAFFRENGVPATYIGHPLTSRVKPSLSREEFFRKHEIPLERPLIAVLPGSRRSEAFRHLPELRRAAGLLSRDRDLTFILPASATCGAAFFEQPLRGTGIRAIEGESWDTLAHCNVALAASGTVTVEAALLGAPMVTYYKVTGVSWLIGRFLVDVPFYSMVNLIAQRQVVPELMQERMTGENLAREAAALLDDAAACARMRAGLAEVAQKLTGPGDAIERAAVEVEKTWEAIQ